MEGFQKPEGTRNDVVLPQGERSGGEKERTKGLESSIEEIGAVGGEEERGDESLVDIDGGGRITLVGLNGGEEGSALAKFAGVEGKVRC